jgi:DNA-binding SARP family transcriptional activator/tetratricopeptide (TPR) repeat protein
MADELEFCLLGPLVVRSGGAVVRVRQAKQRVLLAALLLDANRVVRVDALAEALWGSATPPSARNTVRNYVKRLREALGAAGRARITSQPRGYSMQVSPGELDVRRFEVLLEAARGAARNGSWAGAAEQASAALLLWQGEALADIDSDLLRQREVSRLAEMRLYAEEIRVDAAVHLGRQAEVIGELRQHVTANPLRERFHALLMLALYCDGRQAEALAAYQHAYRVLADELAAEPGIELRELHQRILSGEPAFGAPEPASAMAQTLSGNPVARPLPGPATDQVSPAPRQLGRAGAAAVPRQLPAAVGCFTGRDAELAALAGLLDGQPGARPPAMVISAIGGTAGVGKTALAVHWAHQVAARFPDGQLYVNLRGYDPGQPLSAADALAGFLRALGVAAPAVPVAVGERAALFRSLLAGRRVLVVLDNASEVEQVRPLLPGTTSCAALVTSRDSLAGLVAREGARRLDLDLLDPAAAVSLLRALIGARVDADPRAAARLAAECGRLPLALRVAAELAAARPGVPLAGLADDLADQQRRLDLLDAGGDPCSAVRTVFSWSYRHLDADSARAFRLLSLHPGSDFDAYAAAALTGAALPRAGQLIDRLVRAHLIQRAGPGRYGLHDLLRVYARQLAAADDREESQRAALTGLFDHYLQTAATAMDALFPAESGRRPRIFPSTNPALPVTDPAAARAWLDAELANLAATAAHTSAQGWPGHAIHLAVTLFRYLDAGGHVPEAVSIHMHAHRAAAQTGDLAAKAETLTSLGVVDLRQGGFEHAARRFREALTLRREIGDRAGEARALHNLGGADLHQGRYEQAARRFREALALRRELGDRAGEARALGNLGALDLRRGRYRQAARYLQLALAVCGELSDRAGEAHALGFLGTLHLRHGRYQDAASHYRQALALCREFGVRSSEAAALNGLGEVLLATGQPGQASAQHAIALDLAGQTGDWFEQARAHSGLAQVHDAVGDADQALRHWEEALRLYTGLGAPEAHQIRAHLDRAALPT